MLGTLFTLWPTTLGTRIADGTASAARRALPMLAAGLALAVGGILAASQWLTLAGLACYAAGVGVAIIPLVRALGTRRPRGPAAWMLAAAIGWLGVAVLIEAVRLLVAGSIDALPDAVGAVVPVFVLGFTVQVLVGTLTQLLPVVLGRGPVEHKALSAALARGWQVRMLLTNLAVPLVAGDWPRPLPLIGWAFGALGVGTFVVLALRAAIPVALRGAATTVQAQDRPSPSSGTTTGIAAGLAVVVLAVALATTGTTEAPGTPASGAAHTVEVTMSAMRIRPSTVDIPLGTRLVLRVTNQDSMPHDLRADGGQRTPRLRQGETALLDLGEIQGDHQAWCDVAGHRAAGMTMTIRTYPAAADTGQDHDPDTGHGLDPGAAPSPGWTPHDARLAPPAGTVHRVELHVTEQDVEIAPGVRERRWTFGRTAPGPVLHGRVGDRFEITLVNDATMGHGIDFHAGALAPDQPMRTIGPGERLVYRFTAHRRVPGSITAPRCPCLSTSPTACTARSSSTRPVCPPSTTSICSSPPSSTSALPTATSMSPRSTRDDRTAGRSTARPSSTTTRRSHRSARQDLADQCRARRRHRLPRRRRPVRHPLQRGQLASPARRSRRRPSARPRPGRGRLRRTDLPRTRPLPVRGPRHASRRERRPWPVHRHGASTVIDIWTIVRFLHVLGAIIWVGGQLTITVVVLPPVRRLLGLAERTEVLRTAGKRFA